MIRCKVLQLSEEKQENEELLGLIIQYNTKKHLFVNVYFLCNAIQYNSVEFHPTELHYMALRRK